MEFYSGTIVKQAKKNHYCHICGRKISVGDSYVRESGKYDGEFFDRCTCLLCDKIREKYAAEVESVYSPDDIFFFANEKVCAGCEKKDDCDINTMNCQKVEDYFMRREDK